MNRTKIGTAKLKYDSDGDLQIGFFQPRITVTKDQVKQFGLTKCTNKTPDEIKNCAQLLLASFFNKVNEIELRDFEKTTLETNIVSTQHYDTGLVKEIEIEFVYVD